MAKKPKETKIVVEINERVRVIADDIQWIIQTRENPEKAWSNSKFCRKRAGLVLNLKEMVRHVMISFDPEIVSRIKAAEVAAEEACAKLPEIFPEEK